MSSRERVRCVFRHREPDRMPVTLDVGSAPGIDTSYIDVFRRMTGSEDPAEFFGYDIRSVDAPLTPTASDFSRYHEAVPPGTTFDEFGVGHVPGTLFPLGRELHPCECLDSADEISGFPLPTFELRDTTLQAIRRMHDRGLAVSVAAGSINEWCYKLRGMDHFLMDLAVQPEMAEALLARITGLVAEMGRELAGAGADILCFYGDMGAQNSLLMGPQTWSEWILPRWQTIIHEVRREAPESLLFYHSCGYIEPIIPGLIDAGFDILNPVQPESMSPAKIKREFGGRIALWGGIGMQSTMHGGSAEQVRQAVRELIDLWAPGGGAIVTAAQTMLADVPWDNVTALVETIREHGRTAFGRRRRIEDGSAQGAAL